MTPGGPLELKYWLGDLDRDGYRMAVRFEAYGAWYLTVLGDELPTGYIPDVASILSFPDPARHAPLWLHLSVEHGGKKTLSMDDPSLPAAVRAMK